MTLAAPNLDYSSAMKSAFELLRAVEKESPTQKLTAKQKSRLAEIDGEINAKTPSESLS
jgi:hypothetical protein